MFPVDTLDTIAEGSTLKSHGDVKSSVGVSYAPAVQDSSDDLSHRFYTDPSMDGRWTGHRDSLNKRLTVVQKHVHTMSHGNEQNRNVGDYRRSMGLNKYWGKTRKMRVDGPSNTQPVGCNGPVICQLGRAMRGVVTQHNPVAPVHAAPHMQFSHGGVSKERVGGDVSMIGAGNTVPMDTPNNSYMNNAVGLHYVMKIGAASAYMGMEKQNFMRGMSTGGEV